MRREGTTSLDPTPSSSPGWPTNGRHGNSCHSQKRVARRGLTEVTKRGGQLITGAVWSGVFVVLAPLCLDGGGMLALLSTLGASARGNYCKLAAVLVQSQEGSSWKKGAGRDE